MEYEGRPGWKMMMSRLEDEERAGCIGEKSRAEQIMDNGICRESRVEDEGRASRNT